MRELGRQKPHMDGLFLALFYACSIMGFFDVHWSIIFMSFVLVSLIQGIYLFHVWSADK